MEDNEETNEMGISEEVKSDWPRLRLNPFEIILDPENPRLDLPPGAGQADIRKALFDQEEVLELIESIIDNGGLFQGEDSIIVIKDNDKYKVLEGNRRICAIQCILNPSIAPPDYQEDIRALINNTGFNTNHLQNVKVAVAPSWEAAQGTITARHSLYKIKKWSYVSKWKRDYKMFQRYKDIDKVAEILRETRGDVVKNLRDYAYVRYMLDLPVWTDEEKKKLSSNYLEVSILARVMSDSDLRRTLGIEWDQNYNITTKMELRKFNYVYEKLIRAIYLNDKEPIQTRTSKKSIQDRIGEWIAEFDRNNPNKTQENSAPVAVQGGPTSTPTTPTGINPTIRIRRRVKKKPDRFFESLYDNINVEDQRLKRLAKELSTNDMDERPISGILLTRAIIESALLFRIKRHRLVGDLKKYLKEKNNRDIDSADLSDLLSFCISRVDKLFQETRGAKEALERIQSDYRKKMNSIVHGDWIDPTASLIEEIAGATRKLLTTILRDED